LRLAARRRSGLHGLPRRALGTAGLDLAVHQQDVELRAAAADLKRDFAVDRELRLGCHRERPDLGAHEQVPLAVMTRHNAAQGGSDRQLWRLRRRV
jgi:hypothetical protein